MSNDAAISEMVNAQANSMGITTNENTNNGAMSVTVEHSRAGEFSAGPVRIEGTPPKPGRIADDGSLDIGTTAAALQSNIATLQGRLDAHSFDPVTGAKVYNLPEHSPTRRAAQMQIDQARRSADFQLSRLEALKVQREADAQAGSIASDPRNLIAIAAGGNPAFAQAITDALAKQDAEAVAAAIRKARDGQ